MDKVYAGRYPVDDAILDRFAYDHDAPEDALEEELRRLVKRVIQDHTEQDGEWEYASVMEEVTSIMEPILDYIINQERQEQEQV